ncbi:hypothetical protein J437_LFUL003557 [Ladona fulva]|uniref:Uncharacterized protein n=1 Tax=Ladona fulva TaxID=123851 RepID=A0A8K0NV93_LADFU|nr:hypothetical protein J437_LFUL003557 [Ladona fulva]
MEGTPKSRNQIKLSLSGTGENTIPDQSTPETSASRRVNQNIVDDISPVDSPEWSEHLTQRVYWRWRSPDESARKCIIARKESTPKAESKYTPPKPKRKIIRRNYSENLSKWAEEFKSIQEELNAAKAKAEVEEKLAKEAPLDNVPEKAPVIHKEKGEEGNANLNDLHCLEKPLEAVSQDVLVVEITQGLTSLKSFPPNHQFPKVPKLDVENDMNRSDFTILMEDNSIEDEMIKCTQQIEEQLLGCKKLAQSENNKVAISTPANNSKVIDAMSKFTDYVKSPRRVSSPLRNSKSPVIKNTPMEKIWRSAEVMSTLGKEGCGVVSWNSEVTDTRKLESNEEEVLFGDDSFDNIMLELVVETEKSPSPTKAIRMEGNDFPNGATEKNDKIGEISVKNSDSFGMLEDDSIIQPDVLNFLDIVESQAIAASQPLKCTPEEIQKKKIEAKKKLAVGKRKRKSEMALSIANPINKAKGLVKS